VGYNAVRYAWKSADVSEESENSMKDAASKALHDVLPQKIEFLKTTAVLTSNPTTVMRLL
jgi:hypothetical protein